MPLLIIYSNVDLIVKMLSLLDSIFLQFAFFPALQEEKLGRKKKRGGVWRSLTKGYGLLEPVLNYL